MRTTFKIVLLTATCSLLTVLASCTIVDLQDPLKGKITLTTDWSKRTTGIEQPASYTVSINSQAFNFTAATNLMPELNSGTYFVYVYNTPEKMSISGTTATVATTGNAVDPLPGWFFAAVKEAVYADFKEETITAVMQQQTRQLTLTLKPEGGTVDRITGITARLTGIAGEWDFKVNKPTGNAMNVPLVFTKQDDGTWQATVRLLGITGTLQKLIGIVAFQDDSPTDITLDCDLSASLSKFNSDKKTPLSLRGDMKETSTEFGLTGIITSWEPGNGIGESSNAE